MRLKKNNFDLQFALSCFVRYSTLKKINQDVHYRMTEKLQSYYLSKVEPFRSCLLALREIILDHNPVITETQKYFMPCFCYKKKIICYLWTDRKTDEPYILVADGKLFDMPELEQGKRSRMKIFRVDPEKDLPLEMIRLILNKALENLSKEQKNK